MPRIARNTPDGAPRRFSATVHDGPAEVPAWRRIRLSYASGRVVTLAYETRPADPSELPALMLVLQVAAGHHGFAIEVTDADGTTTTAPAIRLERAS